MLTFQEIQKTNKSITYQDIQSQYTKCVYQDKGTNPRCIKFYNDANINCIKAVAEYFTQFNKVFNVILDGKIIGLKLEV